VCVCVCVCARARVCVRTLIMKCLLWQWKRLKLFPSLCIFTNSYLVTFYLVLQVLKNYFFKKIITNSEVSVLILLFWVMTLYELVQQCCGITYVWVHMASQIRTTTSPSLLREPQILHVRFLVYKNWYKNVSVVVTECHGWVVNIHASYSRGTGF
jgi:hypothetical protein